MVRRGNAPGPLFHFQDGAPLTQQRFVVELRKALQMIGEDPQQFGGHSFRAGAATTAAQQGIGDATIKLLGRWHSSAYQVYIKTPVSSLAAWLLANSGQFRQAFFRRWMGTARCTAINKETLQATRLLAPKTRRICELVVAIINICIFCRHMIM